MAPWLRGLGVRRVVTRRMDYVPRGGPWVRYLYNGAVDRVIAISGAVRDALVAGGVEANRIALVPSGIDPEPFAAAAWERARVRAEWNVGEEDVVAIVVGVLEHRKGHSTLIDAAARIDGGLRLRWVFCGTGSIEAELRAQAARCGVTVSFLGFRDDVARCLAGADLAVLPSRHEGLGIAALEAMAAARPVVASRVGGLAEVVLEGESGYLLPPSDVEGFAAAFAKLARSADLRRRLGEAGAARVRARYSAVAMAEGTLACYLRSP
jgi:glycosyltransferase involved in cell wall biosynthesis